jgi:hypothetical protein
MAPANSAFGTVAPLAERARTAEGYNSTQEEVDRIVRGINGK